MREQNPTPLLLMAEDNDEDFFLAQEALGRCRARHRLSRVRDGLELMDYLLRRGPYADPASSPRPTVILLDLNMPRKDGFETLREIKSDPALRRIPVVIFTTARVDENVQRGYDLGCNAFVQKPIGLAPLTRTLDAVSQLFLDLAALQPE